MNTANILTGLAYKYQSHHQQLLDKPTALYNQTFEEGYGTWGATEPPYSAPQLFQYFIL